MSDVMKDVYKEKENEDLKVSYPVLKEDEYIDSAQQLSEYQSLIIKSTSFIKHNSARKGYNR